MNAPFVPDQATTIDWDSVAAVVNEWRGHCLCHYAKAEGSISETLLHLSLDKSAGVVTLPQLVGQRVAELERLLSGGSVADAGKALAALRDFREHDRLRTFLCHGVSKVVADKHGEWFVALRLLAFRNGVPTRDHRFLSRSEAEGCCQALGRSAQRLVSHLAALRAA